MTTWLLIELLLSTAAVACTIWAVARKQTAHRWFRIGLVVASLGLAFDLLWRIVENLGTVSETTLAVQSLVFANAMACAILVARLRSASPSHS